MGLPGHRWERGRTNTNERGNSYDRRRRRKWIIKEFESDQGPGTCRCYRCGRVLTEDTLSIDRIKPGKDGGRYTRENIRPACLPCNTRDGAAMTNGVYDEPGSDVDEPTEAVADAGEAPF